MPWCNLTTVVNGLVVFGSWVTNAVLQFYTILIGWTRHDQL